MVRVRNVRPTMPSSVSAQHACRRCHRWQMRAAACGFRRPESAAGRCRQLLQQRLRLLQIARIEPLSEPPVNRSKQFARLLHLALVAPEACEPHRGRWFSGFACCCFSGSIERRRRFSLPCVLTAALRSQQQKLRAQTRLAASPSSRWPAKAGNGRSPFEISLGAIESWQRPRPALENPDHPIASREPSRSSAKAGQNSAGANRCIC